MTPIHLKLAMYGVAASLLFLSGFMVNGWRWESKWADHEREIVAQIEQARKAHQEKIKEADKLYSDLEKSRDETKKLRADVAAGRVGVRINAVCPGREGTSTRVDQEGTPRLTPDAEQGYWDLRDGIKEQYIQLKACIKLITE